jgi:hypothetical protein
VKIVMWTQGKKFRIIEENGKYYPQVKGWFFWSKLYYRVGKSIEWLATYKFDSVSEAIDFLRNCGGTTGILGRKDFKEPVV